jgi:branched-chain amino acid transport system substrate-binding protein
MGGDGIADPQYIELGGRPGDFATNIGAPVESLSSARAFVDAYAAAGYPEPSSAYGPMTFDATNVIIGALAGVVRNGPFEESSRQRLVEAVQRTNLPGASGMVAFDEFGDTTNKVLTVSTVKDGEFEPLETGVFEQSN